MPRELRPKGRVVIRLDSLDSEGEMLSDLIQELHRGLGVVVIIDAQYAETRGFVDGGELIEALTRSAHTGNEFHIELRRAARDLKGSVGRLGAWAILLQGDSANVMPVKDLGRRSWTAPSTGDPVTGKSLEPEITKSSRSLWPAGRIKERTPTAKTAVPASTADKGEVVH